MLLAQFDFVYNNDKYHHSFCYPDGGDKWGFIPGYKSYDENNVPILWLCKEKMGEFFSQVLDKENVNSFSVKVHNTYSIKRYKLSAGWDDNVCFALWDEIDVNPSITKMLNKYGKKVWLEFVCIK